MSDDALGSGKLTARGGTQADTDISPFRPARLIGPWTSI